MLRKGHRCSSPPCTDNLGSLRSHTEQQNLLFKLLHLSAVVEAAQHDTLNRIVLSKRSFGSDYSQSVRSKPTQAFQTGHQFSKLRAGNRAPDGLAGADWVGEAEEQVLERHDHRLKPKNERIKGQNTASMNLPQYGSLDRRHASLQRTVPLPKYNKKSRPNKGTLPFANQI
ncbi:hypothetical protein Q7C36_000748 [Tachysurus vachellii]|uniref:Uncharacterized protein n=1 Tax=Tachysurus vachellii TaxID=175792 RepID=A0AA88T8F9_TACVA|nr:hypothetical protein Q7C36_000748 [Tachysurus vachellii]